MASSHYPNQRWLKQCLHKARYHSDVLLIATLQMCFIEINKVVYVSGIWLGMGVGCHYDVPAKMASAPIMPAQWDCQGGSRQESLCHCYIVPIVKILAILAPKLRSRACVLRVWSPPAAIAVTQAISQTLICKALRIDSPPHAQMNKQRHKTWSFCLKYYILSKSNKIQRQVGVIFNLWQFLLDLIAHCR